MTAGGTSSRRVWLVRAALGLLLAACAVTIGLWPSSGTPPAQAQNLDDSSAWLLSAAASEAVLVDGASPAIVRRVALAPQPVSVTQSAADAFGALVNGTVQRVDGSTFDTGTPVSFVGTGTGSSAGPAGGLLASRGPRLAVYPTPAAVFVVDRLTGVASVVDPATLQTVRTYLLADPTKMPTDLAAISDATGRGEPRLWAVDGTGALVQLDGGGARTWAGAVANPAQARLVDAGGRPVAVDLAAGSVRAVGADGLNGERGCVRRQTGLSTIRITGGAQAPRLYLVNGETGVLMVSDLATGRCDEALPVAGPGHTLGQPQEAAGRVFVPDRTTGEVIVVDVADPPAPGSSPGPRCSTSRAPRSSWSPKDR